jgi:Arc/MetJ-type ribon-helix-helix transcriptional regulator
MLNTPKEAVEKITISEPADLIRFIDSEVAKDPDLDRSKYIRRLLRQAQEGAKQLALLEVKQ